MALHGGDFWSFLASLSPFESWRKYVVFRHKRDQDHGYRDTAEARRLDLENEARELAIIEKRAKIAKQLGATKEELQPPCERVLRSHVENPAVTIVHAIPEKEPLRLTAGAEHVRNGFTIDNMQEPGGDAQSDSSREKPPGLRS